MSLKKKIMKPCVACLKAYRRVIQPYMCLMFYNINVFSIINAGLREFLTMNLKYCRCLCYRNIVRDERK